MRKLLRALPILVSGALLAASSLAAQAAGIAGAPAPFDQGGVKVALVSLISQGDFFEAYQTGAERQARALGINLRLFPGNGDAAAERDAIQQAINLGVKAIVIDHGFPSSISDLAQPSRGGGHQGGGLRCQLEQPEDPPGGAERP